MTTSPLPRVQLALNVDDLDAAVDFYSRLLGVPAAKRRPGYANFAVAEPPLKLVLLENPGQGGTLNHLGVEVGSTAEVAGATRRLAEQGLPTELEDGVTCCHALQDKVWATAPDGERWEVYTVLADTPEGTTHDGRPMLDLQTASSAASSSTGSICCG